LRPFAPICARLRPFAPVCASPSRLSGLVFPRKSRLANK
jgi:hypothetical protein